MFTCKRVSQIGLSSIPNQYELAGIYHRSMSIFFGRAINGQ